MCKVGELIYLDYNATTPVAAEVVETVTRVLSNVWGNPSSQNPIGKCAKQELEGSRAQVATMVNARSASDIIFTSGGTEANKLALESVVYAQARNHNGVLPHVITSNVEHVSVSKVLQNLRQHSLIELTEVPVQKKNGQLNAAEVLAAITPQTVLITVMHANNETGIIMPIAEIGRKLTDVNAKRVVEQLPRIYFHTDAAQTIGKLDVDVQSLNVDYLTVVGHKFYGTKIGALYARDPGNHSPIIPTFLGGGQENGFRAGTENLGMIAGLGKAAEMVVKDGLHYSAHMQEMRNALAQQLKAAIPGLEINFNLEHCLPNTLSAAVPKGLMGKDVLERVENMVCMSLGAACHSVTEGSSSILSASGLPVEQAARTVRLSVGRETTSAEISKAVEVLAEACKEFYKCNE